MDLSLDLVRAGHVAGRVIGPDGKPVRARVWYRVEGESGAMKFHATDAEGRFDVDVPPNFRGTFHASRSGVNALPLSFKVDGVVAGQTDVVIRVTR